MLIAPVCEYINLWDGNILMSTIILPGNMLMKVNFPKILPTPVHGITNWKNNQEYNLGKSHS